MEEVNKLGKILIVDDNEDVLFALNLLLEPYTEKIKVATTPDRIEHFMTTFQPDLILLDMNFSRDAISGQEGFESLKQILKMPMQILIKQYGLSKPVQQTLSPNRGKRKNYWPLLLPECDYVTLNGK